MVPIAIAYIIRGKKEDNTIFEGYIYVQENGVVTAENLFTSNLAAEQIYITVFVRKSFP